MMDRAPGVHVAPTYLKWVVAGALLLLVATFVGWGSSTSVAQPLIQDPAEPVGTSGVPVENPVGPVGAPAGDLVGPSDAAAVVPAPAFDVPSEDPAASAAPSAPASASSSIASASASTSASASVSASAPSSSAASASASTAATASATFEPACPPDEGLTEQQLPVLGQQYRCIDGLEAWKVAGDGGRLLSRYFPSAYGTLLVNSVDIVGTCAQTQGVANWRLYVYEQNPAYAGVMLVISERTLSSPGRVVVGCALDQLNSVMGGGLGGIEACAHSFAYRAYGDTFYAVVGGTKIGEASICNSLTWTHYQEHASNIEYGSYRPNVFDF